MITKNICGILVYGYPCWNEETNYLYDTELVIEYGDYHYFNEKVLDITFDNNRYIHRLSPPSNPIFRVKEEVWLTVSPTVEINKISGQRLKCLNPNTNEFVYFVSKGIGTGAPYINSVFNSAFYTSLWGETSNACEVFNPISCATWEGLTFESKASTRTQVSDTFSFTQESLALSPILFSKSNQTNTKRFTSWESR